MKYRFDGLARMGNGWDGVTDCFFRQTIYDYSMTQALEKASHLPSEDQDVFADFILHELAFRRAVQKGIEAADRGEVVSIEEVKKMGFQIVYTTPAIEDLIVRENLDTDFTDLKIITLMQPLSGLWYFMVVVPG